MNAINFYKSLRLLPLLGLFVVGSTAIAQSAKTPVKAEMVDSIVAVVNDEVITFNELQARIEMVTQRMRSQNVPIPPLTDMRRQVLERLIVEAAQMQLAKDGGLRVDDTTLDRAIVRVAEQNKMTVQQLRDQIEKDGLAYAAYREDIRNQITLIRLREREVDSKVVISDAEVENFLAAEAATVQTQQEINLAQILIRIPENASSEVIAARRSKAEEALQKVKAGEDFVKLAGSYSDATDALTGGDMGWRSPDRLPQLFVNAVLPLKEGQVASLIKSPNGFHILKVLGKRSLPSVAGTKGASTIQQTRARHILIKVNQVVSQADARRKLQEVKDRLQNKAATFEELAKSFSNDGSANKGGDLGWLFPGDTVPEFETAMNALKIGELSEPIETQFGLHLVEVLERKTDDMSNERKKQEARQTLRARKIDENNEDWLRQLRDRAYVEIRLEGSK
jgi:peptidyl-prolyl cis-trans isomerase SurA